MRSEEEALSVFATTTTPQRVRSSFKYIIRCLRCRRRRALGSTGKGYIRGEKTRPTNCCCYRCCCYVDAIILRAPVREDFRIRKCPACCDYVLGMRVVWRLRITLADICVIHCSHDFFGLIKNSRVYDEESRGMYPSRELRANWDFIILSPLYIWLWTLMPESESFSRLYPRAYVCSKDFSRERRELFIRTAELRFESAVHDVCMDFYMF